MAKRIGQYGQNRFYEILPGALTWSVLLFAFGSSFFAPVVAVIFIIIFDLYWTLRVLYFIIHVIASYVNYRKTAAVDWMNEVRKLPGSDEIYHVVMLPTYKEDISIIRSALRALELNPYPSDRFIVVVGGEERAKEQFISYANKLKQEFGGKFAHLMFTIHPKDIAGELPGKGSNMKWMGQEAQKVINTLAIPYDKIIVSAFDVDTNAHAQYFARLTQLFLTVENPLRASYQPLTLFSNNVWDANPVVRISSFGTTFWLLGELVRSERMWTFSSHSMPWQMLVDVGFHEPDLVSEDSRIFMQGFLRYEGDYRVVPMFLPVAMDAVEAGTFWGSLVALYKQQRRWAWGVEHVPYMAREFRKHPKIPRRKKMEFMFNHIEGMLTWATAPVLIFVLGYLPFLVIGNAPSALVANTPFTLELMMRIATVGVFFSAGVSFLFLPPRPAHHARHAWLIMIAQWLLLPVTFTLFGALPALDAQTRMMFGKYLGFNVTAKKPVVK